MFSWVIFTIRLCLVSDLLQTCFPSNFFPLCTPSDFIARGYSRTHIQIHRHSHTLAKYQQCRYFGKSCVISLKYMGEERLCCWAELVLIRLWRQCGAQQDEGAYFWKLCSRGLKRGPLHFLVYLYCEVESHSTQRRGSVCAWQMLASVRCAVEH